MCCTSKTQLILESLSDDGDVASFVRQDTCRVRAAVRRDELDLRDFKSNGVVVIKVPIFKVGVES